MHISNLRFLALDIATTLEVPVLLTFAPTSNIHTLFTIDLTLFIVYRLHMAYMSPDIISPPDICSHTTRNFILLVADCRLRWKQLSNCSK